MKNCVVFNAILGLLCKISVFTSLIFFLFPINSWGKPLFSELPLTVVHNPNSYEIGDTIALEFHLGDSLNQPESASSFHLVHNYSSENHDIGSDSDFEYEIANDWGCENGNCEVDIWLDTEAEELHVIISSNSLLEGYGKLVTISGIIIEIDIVHNRVSSISQEKEEVTLNIFPNPASVYLMLSFNHAVKGNIEVYSISGKLINVFPINGRKTKIPVNQLNPGIYLLRIDSENLVVEKKFKVIQ